MIRMLKANGFSFTLRTILKSKTAPIHINWPVSLPPAALPGKVGTADNFGTCSVRNMNQAILGYLADIQNLKLSRNSKKKRKYLG